MERAKSRDEGSGICKIVLGAASPPRASWRMTCSIDAAPGSVPPRRAALSCSRWQHTFMLADESALCSPRGLRSSANLAAKRDLLRVWLVTESVDWWITSSSSGFVVTWFYSDCRTGTNVCVHHRRLFEKKPLWVRQSRNDYSCFIFFLLYQGIFVVLLFLSTPITFTQQNGILF